MPIFFLATGLRTSWQMGGLAVVGCGWRQIGRGSDCGTNPKLAKGRWVGDWLAFTNQGLDFDYFSNVLLDKGLISGATFTALLLLAVASTVLTIPIVTRWLSAR